MPDGVRNHLEADDAAALEVVGLVIAHQEAQVVKQEPCSARSVTHGEAMACLSAHRTRVLIVFRVTIRLLAAL